MTANVFINLFAANKLLDIPCCLESRQRRDWTLDIRIP